MTVDGVTCGETRDALDALSVARRIRIHGEAREVGVLARLAADPDPYRDDRGQLGKEWIVEDVACALTVSSTVAAAKLHVAVQLTTRFRQTYEALRRARLDLRAATRIVELAEALPDPALPGLESEILDAVESRTLRQLCARVRRAVARHDPRAADERHRTALALRRVVFTPADHGMTELWAVLPAAGAAALKAALQRAADRSRTDGRTADQRRADALCDLASAEGQATSGGRATGGLRPQVLVTVAASTLLGEDDAPGELAGHGPISAAAARALAFDPTGTWRRLLTDSAGNLTDVSSRSYRPPAALRRFVELRDRTCRFPTCNRRAESCEIDHVTAHADGGATAAVNLIPLCPRHHHLKHDGGWGIARHPDGAVTWTSPTGRTWTTPPPDPLGTG